MKKIADPKKAQRRERDLTLKRERRRVAKELKASKKEAREREAEVLAELRLADELAKPKHAAKNSGRRKRKLARKTDRPAQEVTPKAGTVPLVPREEHFEQGVITTPKKFRRKFTGKNKVVVNREYSRSGGVTKPVIGMVEYAVKKTAKHQRANGKEHKPYEVPKRASIVNHGVASLLRLQAEQTGCPTRSIPITYVGKKGVIVRELVQVLVESYAKPTSIPIDRSPDVEPRRPAPKSGVVLKSQNPKQPKNGDKTLVVYDEEMSVTRGDQREWKLGKKYRKAELQAENKERREKRIEEEAKQPVKKSKVKPRIAKKLAKLAARQGQAMVTRVKVQKVDTSAGTLIVGEYRTKSGRKITVQAKGTHSSTVSSAA